MQTGLDAADVEQAARKVDAKQWTNRGVAVVTVKAPPSASCAKQVSSDLFSPSSTRSRGERAASRSYSSRSVSSQTSSMCL